MGATWEVWDLNERSEVMKNQKILFLISSYICFVIFGVLISLSKTDFRWSNLFIMVMLSFVIGITEVNLLILFLNLVNKKERKEKGSHYIAEAVGMGMLFMIPFTVLAILAQFLLGWSTIMPFASAAITTSSATAGTEVMKKGGKGMKNVLIPSALAMIFSTIWMFGCALIP